MDQVFEGTPQAEIRLEGRKVVRGDVSNDWASRLQWKISRNGQVIATPFARLETAYEHPDQTPALTKSSSKCGSTRATRRAARGNTWRFPIAFRTRSKWVSLLAAAAIMMAAAVSADDKIGTTPLAQQPGWCRPNSCTSERPLPSAMLRQSPKPGRPGGSLVWRHRRRRKGRRHLAGAARCRDLVGPVQVVSGAGDNGQPMPCWNPVLHQAPDGPLVLFYKVGPSPDTWWGMLTTSSDEGQTWSSPRRLPPGILGPIKNKPLAQADGSLLCGSSTEHDGWRVHFERTTDLGKTWSGRGHPRRPCILRDSAHDTAAWRR